MKYLSHYMEERQTAAFNEAGAFFAFGQAQFDEKAVKGITYTDMGAGLICPKGKAAWLFEQLENIFKTSVEQDMAENGKKAIIHRELANHEAQITGDVEETVAALEGYPITVEEIQAEYPEYYQKCVDNDWF